MAYLPLKARSALVWPRNSRGGGVCDRTLRFQVASCALNMPALRPTRGSGFGGVADMLLVVAVEWAQPTAAATLRVSVRDRTEAKLIPAPWVSGRIEKQGAAGTWPERRPVEDGESAERGPGRRELAHRAR